MDHCTTTGPAPQGTPTPSPATHASTSTQTACPPHGTSVEGPGAVSPLLWILGALIILAVMCEAARPLRKRRR